MLIGESASGKSTIERELEKYGFNRIISYTSRPKREHEKDGVDYHYISKERFKELLNEGFFVEFTEYNGWYYGIAKEDCCDNSIAVVEPYGFRQLQKIKGLNIISFYIKTSERERLKRMADRGDNLMELFRRIISDQGVFQGIEKEVDCVVDNNGDYKDAVEKILDVIKRWTWRE